jgi:PAS domain S-box-containing protein
MTHSETRLPDPRCAIAECLQARVVVCVVRSAEGFALYGRYLGSKGRLTDSLNISLPNARSLFTKGCENDLVFEGLPSTIARDMTAARQAFEAARSMIESSLDSLVAISAEGKITDANQATVKLTGVPRDQLIGTSFSDYFTDPAKAEEIYQRVFTDGMAADYPLTLRHRDRHETSTDVLYNASVYRDTAGNVLGVFAAARDVTEQMRAQREVVERLTELERFQRLTVGRELKMIELKKEIENLKKLAPPSKTSLMAKGDSMERQGLINVLDSGGGLGAGTLVHSVT